MKIDVASLGAIGQISRQVRDIPRAVEWFRDTLGLPHLYTFGNLAFFDCGGTRLYLNRAADDSELRDSCLYFRVDDIQTTHDLLRTRGVAFRAAPQLIHRHDNGMEEWMAFFEDCDGQLLALMSQITKK